MYKNAALKYREALEKGGSGVQLASLSQQDIKQARSRAGLGKRVDTNLPKQEESSTPDMETVLLQRMADAHQRVQDAPTTRERFLDMVRNQDLDVETVEEALEAVESNGLGSRPTDVSPSAEAAEVQETTGELPTGANALLRDDEFMGQLSLMQDKYPGLTQKEIFDVIQGESSFRTGVVTGSYKGLFQIGPEVAQDILKYTGTDIDYENLEKKSAAEQLKAYDKLLERWGYDGTYALGILQAAPSKRNASPDTIIYKAGSVEAKANPGWLDANGNATVASINKYYGY